MGWLGLGKPRSKFGSWLDEKGIKQEEMCNMTGLDRNTISRAANNEDWIPSRKNVNKIMDAVNEIDEDKTTRDFWEW